MIDTPVLIVGGGPVGLISALLCARLGIAARLIERRPTRLDAPKAHAINPRTLEICRALGVPREAFAGRAMPPADSEWVRFMTRLGGKELGKLPYEWQDAGALDHTPTPLLNIAQPAFEDILAEALAAEPLITVERGRRWVSATQDADGIASSLEDGGTIRSRWLIAADGAESSVRKALGIAMLGPDKLQHRLMIHFQANLRPLLKGREAAIYWNMQPTSPGGFIAFDIGANWVFMYRYDPEIIDPSSFSEADCEALIRAAIDGEAGPIRILNRSPWMLSVQLAERYREDRIFLVGDAAHRFPPTGGLGLNTGVQDAHNLVWKIAAVERCEATQALLDSYEAERRPMADINAAQSHANARALTELFAATKALDTQPGGLGAAIDDPDAAHHIGVLLERQREHFDSFGLQLGFSYGTDQTWADHVSTYRPTTAPGARMPHAWVIRDGVQVSMLDLLALDRFTLVCGSDAARWHGLDFGAPVAIQAEGGAFVDAEGHWSRVAALAPGEALLVRPDGHVLRRSERPGEMLAACAALLNPACS